MQMTMKVFVFMEEVIDYSVPYGHKGYGQKTWAPHAWGVRVNEIESRIFLCETEMNVNVPDDWDPVAKQIEAVKREHDAARTEWLKTDALFKERISKLQAISYEPASAS